MNLPQSFKFTSDRILEIGSTAIIADFHYDVGSDMYTSERVLQNTSDGINTLIINGDLINSFPPSEKALDALQSFNETFEDVIYIEGNHERQVGGVEEYIPKNIDYKKFTTLNYNNMTIGITHGHIYPHELDDTNVDWFVIGHIHPATESKYPCALLNSFKFDQDTSVIVLPAFGSGLSNIPYTEQSRDTDFIENIPQSVVIKTWAR